MANLIGEILGAAAATAKGMGVTMKEMMSPTVTENYPDEPPKLQERYRGVHVLQRDENGLEKCVACFLCAAACPAQCIYIEAGEYDNDDSASESRVIEKFPTAFVIDELRCIVCGLCVDACPKDAIRMDTGTHTPSEYNRQGFVWDIPRLLNGPAVSHPSDPWNKRDSSEAPSHEHQEAHARIGDGLVQLRHPPSSRTVVDKNGTVPVVRFLK
jgi:NADH-quinone oxidoreductase subunit I